MVTLPLPNAPPAARRDLTLLGVLLIVLGLLGHLLAARAIGGTHLAYRDHIFGFLLIGVVSSIIIGGLGWRFWRGRSDITWLTIGVVQALFGVFVYIMRFRVHG
ncbi:MAG: hypothetical protein JJD97_08885 [Gemmatimonadaceae bacterium]|nr:hypothetical protein [Gemmatimonadaceae bacterium]